MYTMKAMGKNFYFELPETVFSIQLHICVYDALWILKKSAYNVRRENTNT